MDPGAWKKWHSGGVGTKILKFLSNEDSFGGCAHALKRNDVQDMKVCKQDSCTESLTFLARSCKSLCSLQRILQFISPWVDMTNKINYCFNSGKLKDVVRAILNTSFCNSFLFKKPGNHLRCTTLYFCLRC